MALQQSSISFMFLFVVSIPFPLFSVRIPRNQFQWQKSAWRGTYSSICCSKGWWVHYIQRALRQAHQSFSNLTRSSWKIFLAAVVLHTSRGIGTIKDCINQRTQLSKVSINICVPSFIHGNHCGVVVMCFFQCSNFLANFFNLLEYKVESTWSNNLLEVYNRFCFFIRFKYACLKIKIYRPNLPCIPGNTLGMERLGCKTQFLSS